MQLKKLTQQQYFEIQAQYDRANENSLFGGDHMILMGLLQKFGYTELSRDSVMRIARQLLEKGYK